MAILNEISVSCGVLSYGFPDNVCWGDYEMDCMSSITMVSKKSVSTDGGDWVVVGTAPKAEEVNTRQPKWCVHGNACIWKNCPFRHERCGHYDSWLARNKKGHNCRCITTDPQSCKSPEQGGCKYDHRDVSKLQTYYKYLPVETEEDLYENFYSRGLEGVSGDVYEISNMKKTDRALLIRSLREYDIEFEDYETWMLIKVY